MPMEVSLPQLGESIAEGTLVKWHKAVGDKIERDEILFEISTDKVDTEIPSPEEGYLAKILVPEGDTVPVNTVVCHISATPIAKSAPAIRDRRNDPHSVHAAPAASAPPKREAPPAPAQTPEAPRPRAAEAAPREGRERTSPLVRRLAAEHDVNLAKIKGTGMGGRVTKQDVLDYIERRPAGPRPPKAGAHSRGPSAPASGILSSMPATMGAPPAGDKGLEDRVEPMSTMRQRISDHMLLSRRTSAHVTTIFEVDITPVRELKNFFAGRFEDRHGVRLTYLPFIIQAVCRGLRQFPVLNASLEGKSVRFHGDINIGVAVALENGLIVPVIRQADTKDLASLTRVLQDLARRARTKELHPEDVQGGTFTVTNPGVFGSLIGTPIINQPQVAILCIGAIQKRPVVLAGTDAIAVRSMAYLSLTFDHRLIDGAIADRFLSKVKTTIESATFDGLSGLK